MSRTKTRNDEDILASIGQYLIREGIATFTFEKLSKEVGLSQATLVQRFGSKRSLLLQLAQQNSQAIIALFRTTTQQYADEPIKAIVQGFGGFVAGVKDKGNMAANLAFLQLAIQDPEIHSAIADSIHQLENMTIILLQSALDNKALQPGTDTVALARLVFTIYNGTIINWAMLNDTTDIQTELTHNLQMIFKPYLKTD